MNILESALFTITAVVGAAWLLIGRMAGMGGSGRGGMGDGGGRASGGSAGGGKGTGGGKTPAVPGGKGKGSNWNKGGKDHGANWDARKSGGKVGASGKAPAKRSKGGKPVAGQHNTAQMESHVDGSTNVTNIGGNVAGGPVGAPPSSAPAVGDGATLPTGDEDGNTMVGGDFGDTTVTNSTSIEFDANGNMVTDN